MKTTGRRDDETTFLNVDLDVWAAYDLVPLVEAFGSHVSDMFTGAAEVEVLLLLCEISCTRRAFATVTRCPAR